jgi:hypothetical protein
MESTHTASLDIPEISEAASLAPVFPDITNNSLLSVRKLCNEGYHDTLKLMASPFSTAAEKRS